MRARVASVAALYDIHGNLPALTAVLAEVDALGIDLILVGGDIASGPLPGETLQSLRRRSDTRFIRGNARRGRSSGPGAVLPRVPSQRRDAYWTLISKEVELRRTDYDLDQAAQSIAATGFPQSEVLIEMLRRPTSSDEASKHFEELASARGAGD